MKAPLFWYRKPQAPGAIARLLAPLSSLYALGTKKRVARSGYAAKIPVICIGNINAGGTGKTPTTIALAQYLVAKGLTVHVVSRGYGGSEPGPLQVDERRHVAAEVGDEPLLMAAFVPVWVAKDRAKGVVTAQNAGADIILLDDGMQNPSVEKDATIIVVDAAMGFGNGRVLPGGPLREPIDEGMARGDLILSIGNAKAQTQFRDNWRGSLSLPHVTGRLEVLQMGIDWRGQKVLAFAGIGHPEKFFQTLRDQGAEILHAEALGDHQPLTTALMKRLETDAAAHGAQLVTTEKDAVRLPRAFRMKVLTLPVRLELADWGEIDRLLAKIGAI